MLFFFEARDRCDPFVYCAKNPVNARVPRLFHDGPPKIGFTFCFPFLLIDEDCASMAADFSPGQRRSYSGAPCTVRYIGHVHGTKGQWLGVEWDDPQRGKHDGSHNGVKYFDCMQP